MSQTVIAIRRRAALVNGPAVVIREVEAERAGTDPMQIVIDREDFIKALKNLPEEQLSRLIIALRS